jgi:hypothetical protein
VERYRLDPIAQPPENAQVSLRGYVYLYTGSVDVEVRILPGAARVAGRTSARHPLVTRRATCTISTLSHVETCEVAEKTQIEKWTDPISATLLPGGARSSTMRPGCFSLASVLREEYISFLAS